MINDNNEDYAFATPKLWVHRLKFNTSLMSIFFIIYFASWILSVFFIMGIDLWLSANRYIIDAFCIVIFLFGIHIGKKVPKNFNDMITNNQEIFLTPNSYKEFLELFQKAIKSKTEYYFPLLCSVLMFLAILGEGFLNDFSYNEWGGVKVPTVGLNRILLVIFLFLLALAYSILVLLVFSGIIVIVIILRSLNKIGSNQFPLKVTYKDLRLGAFNDIGKFIISLSIPLIAASTFLSVIGLFYIYSFNTLSAYAIGYSYLIFGTGVSIIFSILLYKNTTHIHESIVRYKLEMKTKILDEIEVLNASSSSMSGEFQKYTIIRDLHEYFDRIDKISDWPFNPTSLKKLVITLLSSIVPFILSFFGLG